MLFRTEIGLNKSNLTLDHSHKLFFIGSCFADNIGSLLHERWFDVVINPFGTVYNPFSIANIFDRVARHQLIEESELIQYNDLWIHHDFHSKYNSIDKKNILESINKSIAETIKYLTNSDYICITLGTAWVYELISTQEIVSNCHKRPQAFFTKKMLTYEACVQCLEKLYADIICINKNAKIIFTLSPVRHIKDGIENNSLSKATLLQSIHSLTSKYESCTYFSSYEIMMDDLRDYRFYKEDMIHPTEQAVKYIWEKFVNHYMNENTKITITKIEKINTFKQHRPSSADDANYEVQLQKIWAEEIELRSKLKL
jgi:hypothetical protein